MSELTGECLEQWKNDARIVTYGMVILLVVLIIFIVVGLIKGFGVAIESTMYKVFLTMFIFGGIGLILYGHKAFTPARYAVDCITGGSLADKIAAAKKHVAEMHASGQRAIAAITDIETQERELHDGVNELCGLLPGNPVCAKVQEIFPKIEHQFDTLNAVKAIFP